MEEEKPKARARFPIVIKNNRVKAEEEKVVTFAEPATSDVKPEAEEQPKVHVITEAEVGQIVEILPKGSSSAA